MGLVTSRISTMRTLMPCAQAMVVSWMQAEEDVRKPEGFRLPVLATCRVLVAGDLQVSGSVRPRPREPASGDPDGIDLPGVADVLQRIPVQDQEIGRLPGRDR